MSALDNVATGLLYTGAAGRAARTGAGGAARSGSSTGSRTRRGSSRAASASGWRSRGRSSDARRSSSPTSPRGTSTRAPERTSSRCCRPCTRPARRSSRSPTTRDRLSLRAAGGDPRRGAGMTAADVLRTASLGLRTRRARAALSALGIAIGVASMVAVLGISESSKADLLAELDRLGTNLLQVAPGQSFTGDASVLPEAAAPMLRRVDGVEAVAATGRPTSRRSAGTAHRRGRDRRHQRRCGGPRCGPRSAPPCTAARS